MRLYYRVSEGKSYIHLRIEWGALREPTLQAPLEDLMKTLWIDWLANFHPTNATMSVIVSDLTLSCSRRTARRPYTGAVPSREAQRGSFRASHRWGTYARPSGNPRGCHPVTAARAAGYPRGARQRSRGCRTSERAITVCR